MQEPSLLDYLKAKLTPWRGPAPEIPEEKPGKKFRASGVKKATKRSKPAAGIPKIEPLIQVQAFPWRPLSATLLFLAAQYAMSGPDPVWLVALPLMAAALGITIWGARAGEWRLPNLAEAEDFSSVASVRWQALLAGFVFFLLTLFFSGGNRLTPLNLSFWLVAVVLTVTAFWQGEPDWRAWLAKVRAKLADSDWKFRLSRFSAVFILALLVSAFFRFYDLDGVPPEMISDHAEKLFDVNDVLNGQHSIYFVRNTGREALQFYLTAAVTKLFGTGISFLSLKIGTALLGFLSLVYVYLLGKEVGGRWVGLIAMIMMGFAYWPNVLARVALRFILYPAFAAPTLYHFLRGMRTGHLNHYLLAGLFMGVGLHGYTAFRILPLVLVAAVLIYIMHNKDADSRRQSVIGLVLVAIVSLVVLAPLVRYTLEQPGAVGLRMFSRLGDGANPIQGSPILIFLQNLWDSLLMVNVHSGTVWLNGLVHRPAVDAISGALFLLGLVLLGWRYASSRNWLDLFILLAYPLLMLPSILSLAFPIENPALNRSGAAAIAVFIICAFALDSLVHGVKDLIGGKQRTAFAWGLALVILLMASRMNYDMVFHQYREEYTQRSWNSTEIGEVLRGYTDSIGAKENVWVVAYPHWVDTRLVAINAGFPGHDFGVWPEALDTTTAVPGPHLFILKPEDLESLTILESLYPLGQESLYESKVAKKDFLLYFVPDMSEADIEG